MYSRFFDIDWHPPHPGLAGRVLLPILGEQYGVVLERGELRVHYQDGSFWILYHEHRLPLAPKSWIEILNRTREIVLTQGEISNTVAPYLESLMTALGYLPARDECAPDRLRERVREKEIIKARLAALVDESLLVAQALAQSLSELNGTPDEPRSFDRLERILCDQAYRVAYWRVASDEINYRRFFDINELAALRIEEPEVFAQVNDLLFLLVREGRVTGIRVDHVDGLLDPLAYLRAMQQGCNTEDRAQELSIYVVVEKILALDERLPDEWPVHGTTGYDFLNSVGGVFIDGHGARTLIEAYHRLTESSTSFEEVAYSCKRLVLRRALASQIAMLARRIDLISEHDRHSRDFTLADLSEALVEIIACLPVYRTYRRAEDAEMNADDVRWVDQAIAQARRRNPAMPRSLFQFLRSVIAQSSPPGIGQEAQAARLDFVLKMQQLTGAVMAKAIEDTAFYRYYPLTSRGEVGGHPVAPGLSVEAFHRQNQERLARLAHGMIATATHDTKRGEDARARIRILSECPERWIAAFESFQTCNRSQRADLGDGFAPDANEEYLFYQTVLAIWPFESPQAHELELMRARLAEYMVKVMREAKIHTSWVSPNEAWEEAVVTFVHNTLDPEKSEAFIAAMHAFAQPIGRAALWNSLAQVVLKSTSPGVPDFYQGCECWDFSLVDPDNRRPVNFAARIEMLDDLSRRGEGDRVGMIRSLLENPSDGAIKLYVTERCLSLRRRLSQVFRQGNYVALASSGRHAQKIIAFARQSEEGQIIVAVGRLLLPLDACTRAPLGELWSDTQLVLPGAFQAKVLRDLFTGNLYRVRAESIDIASLFSDLPLALLEVVES
jgi:(1->4)-alpha-D-glucan 1-alpha-D-glucosylmutase